MISTPHLASMSRARYVAHERNERSRHEPRIGQRPAKAPPALQASHGVRPWVIEHG